ncbi:hypothetical protein D0T25_07655 [Duganella sp. BJB488]|uniref:hypothetical protein n=2 Tax=Duganella TaxID=75654 RepID=UPI000E354EA8|nr:MULTISPECIES: hypothetical protein [unclassified Duganella]RFP23002.1 hypothetical protein D0T26_08195 [Duganella sp. BJB489]RFP24921.1 hypothetical protein D0T25_07655 [Duganella sp. BJB488]RFP34002.1 hypothetical protein D0T24_16575 [Duganella sp. BJB480]
MITDTFSRLMALLTALHEISPNRFFNMLRDAANVDEFYNAALALGYAANSKELRDTYEEQVHSLSEDIRREVEELNSFFRIKLFPSSPSQKQSWENFVSRDLGGRYAFRDDGSLEISLLDAKLSDSVLHVKRVWSHVSSFGGSLTDFKIKLDANQVTELRTRLAEVRRIRSGAVLPP